MGGWAGRRREARFGQDFSTLARVSSRGNNERVNAGGGFWYVLSAAALGWDALGSARTWAALLLPPPKGLANIPRAGRTPPALLLFLSSIYVVFFFLLLAHSRAERAALDFSERLSLSLFFPFGFFFLPLAAGALPVSRRAGGLSAGADFAPQPSSKQAACEPSPAASRVCAPGVRGEGQ